MDRFDNRDCAVIVYGYAQHQASSLLASRPESNRAASRFCSCPPNVAVQPRRLTIPSAADGCNRLLGSRFWTDLRRDVSTFPDIALESPEGVRKVFAAETDSNVPIPKIEDL